MTKYYNKKKQKRNGTLLLSAIMLMIMMFSLTAPWSASPTYAKDFNPSADRTMAGKDGEALVGLLGNDPEAARHGKKLKRKDTNEDLSFSISLKPRNSGDLDKLIVDLSDPTSPRYHKFITPQEFAAQFGASRAEVSTLTAYLNSKGLKVDEVAPNGLSVKVKGKVAQAEAAFNTQISDYSTAKGEKFQAHDTQIFLPAKLTGLVNGVHLDTEPKSGPDSQDTGLSRVQTLDIGSPDVGYSPAQIRKVYNITPLLDSGYNGAGQTIALVAADDFVPANLVQYANQFGLPANTADWLEVTHTTSYYTDLTPSTPRGQREITMDIEIAHAIAPGAKIRVYRTSATSNGILDAFQWIASQNVAKAVSTSFGYTCEKVASAAGLNSLHATFQQMAVQGQSVFVASGDNGPNGCDFLGSKDPNFGSISVESPASDPLVTAVGGTTLFLNGSGNLVSETGWTIDQGTSGGGTSQTYSRPFYQDQVSTRAYRAVPDVAASASPSLGMAVFINGEKTLGDGKWSVGGGTSAASPLWAGIAALNNHYRQVIGLGNLGQANPSLYKLSQCDSLISSQSAKSFMDITLDSSNVSGSQIYNSGPGYDLRTGLGSPNVSNLVHNLNDSNWCNGGAPQQGATGNKIQNGGFEQGLQFWTQYSSGGFALLTVSQNHGGLFSVNLGGYNSGIDSVRQSINIPAYAKKAVLSFWVKIETKEATTSTIFDAMTTEIYYQDASGVAHTLIPKKLTNLDAPSYGNWKQVTVDVTNLKGMSNMELKFRAATDFSLPTTFYVDDVELVTVNI